MPLALFGITDDGLNLAVNLVILVLVVVWLALAYGTFADARRRIGDPILVTTASVLGLVPFIGPMIYTILRPPEYLEDVREREVETQASELRMRHLTAQSCPRCEHPIERSWLRCPECQHRLKDPCVSCNRPVDPRWSICPYCETQLRRQSAERPDRGVRKKSAESSRRPRSSSRSSDPERSERPSGSTAPKRRKPSTSAPSARSEPAPRTDPGERKPRSSTPGSDADDDGSSDPRPRRRSTTTS